MTSLAPAAPCARLHMMSSTASRASWVVLATTTPLPAARPSALTTRGAPSLTTAFLALSGSVKTWLRAVGTPARFMTSLAKALLPSSRAQ